jgi:predicted nucleic acid binding AN1-type Zn finger protein
MTDSIYNEFSDFINSIKTSSIIQQTHDIININKNNKDTEDTNKKQRCAFCNKKITASEYTISNCRCNKKHCLKHRMPEAHNCDNIKEIVEEQKKNLDKSLIKLEHNKTLNYI